MTPPLVLRTLLCLSLGGCLDDNGEATHATAEDNLALQQIGEQLVRAQLPPGSEPVFREQRFSARQAFCGHVVVLSSEHDSAASRRYIAAGNLVLLEGPGMDAGVFNPAWQQLCEHPVVR